jgi:hypothetical protein
MSYEVAGLLTHPGVLPFPILASEAVPESFVGLLVKGSDDQLIGTITTVSAEDGVIEFRATIEGAPSRRSRQL